MADNAAIRNARLRRHKEGDHTMCLPGRCSLAGGTYVLPGGDPVDPALMVPLTRVPGNIETAVTAFVEALPYQVPDPRALLAQIAVRLAQRVDESGALPAAVRELRVLLAQLVEVPNGPAGPVDEVRLRAAQRKLDSLIGVA